MTVERLTLGTDRLLFSFLSAWRKLWFDIVAFDISIILYIFQLYAEKVTNRGLCAVAQCESLRYKLVGGLAVRRACYGVLRFIMESNAQGCEVSWISFLLKEKLACSSWIHVHEFLLHFINWCVFQKIKKLSNKFAKVGGNLLVVRNEWNLSVIKWYNGVETAL